MIISTFGGHKTGKLIPACFWRGTDCFSQYWPLRLPTQVGAAGKKFPSSPLKLTLKRHKIAASYALDRP